ncbi:beta-ketoacyl-[acyl-carrier-protein] synthase family protein [Chitinophaga sp. NPDC101104]|uniref:beta-ketoacyl-[acyl-carrier-protein] synthase family protein n=1 Tax=Chitinophaga sp. NPDC101104 TaxID=3390561 RepID=UPI003D045DB1
MTKVYVAAENIVSPLGLTAQANFDRLLAGESGIRRQPGGFFASALPEELLRPAAASAGLADNTRFEQLTVLSIKDALSRTKVPIGDPRTAFILSTTKGNIALLEQGKAGQPGASMLLHATAAQVAKTVGAAAQPIVVSNACISGLLAILIAQRLIRAGQYDHAVVCGADELTRFVLSGFQSFQAVSDEPCRPFDAARKGVTLGEGAATVVLTKDTTLLPAGEAILLGEGASSNDANHISGPSRTGAELSSALVSAMHRSRLGPADIGFVSAHGTATLYNDEMEAKAFHLSGLQDVPVNSLKGNYGHTLGAAGLIETVAGIYAMKQGVVLPTAGFESSGISHPLMVSSQLGQRTIRHFLKTTSGFGGCNAAMVFSRVTL